MEERRQNLDASVDVSEMELARTYGPDVVTWKLTETGAQRLEDRQLPPQLPIRAYGLMSLVGRLGIVEEDELSDYLGLSLETIRDLLSRLMGYGYVIKVA